MIPGEYLNSDFWCRSCQKRMIMTLGQDDTDGQLVESHACIHCGRTYTCAPERRALDLPETRAEVLWANLEQWVEFRSRHLDRSEVVGRYADA